MKRGWFWVRLVLALALLGFVIERNGRERILTALATADPLWVAVGAALFFSSILAGAYQWHLLLRLQGVDLGFSEAFRTYYSGMFIGNFLPGTVGGDALRIYAVHKSDAAQGSLGKGAAATLIDRLLGFCALAFFSVAALAFEWQGGSLDAALLRPLLAASGCVAGVFSGVLVLLLSRRVSGFVKTVVGAMGFPRVDSALERVQAALDAYRSQWTRMGFVFFVACLVQFLRVQVHLFSAWALGLYVAPVFFFGFIPLIALAAVIPLNVGGWGLPQSLGSLLYALPGVLALPAGGPLDPGAAAAALAFLPSVIGLIVMLGGGFYFVTRSPGAGRAPS